MKEQNIFLKNLAADNISGSSHLLDVLIKWFINNKFTFDEYLKYFLYIKKYFSELNIIVNFVEECEKVLINNGIESLKLFQRDFIEIQKKEFERLIEKSINNLKKFNRFITISNSKTIENVFTNLSSQKKIQISICESRPMYEGRILAKKLLQTDAKVKLITEAMISTEVENADAVVFGADKYFSNGDVVNKIGSRLLATSALLFRKPVIVITNKLKFSKNHIFEREIRPRKEIWDSSPSGIEIENYYFELIEKKFITKLLTN